MTADSPADPSAGSPAGPARATAARVEDALPTDRGLVARLVEVVVAADASVAPAVADGSLRAAQWLQQGRPDWEGVAVLDGEGVRRVVGYVAALAGPPAAERVLVHPDHRGRGLEAELSAAARRALADAPPPVVVAEPAPDTSPTPLPPRVPWRQRLVEPAGVVVIAAVGLVAVLAVQIGSGPLSDVVPFLRPDRDVPAAEAEPTSGQADGLPAPAPAPASALVPVPGVVLTPAAAPTGPTAAGGSSDPTPGAGGPGTPPDGPAPTPAPPSGPSDPPSDPPGGPSGPGSSGPGSALLDPVVGEVADGADGASGGVTAPVTGAAEDLADATTDVLDGVVGILVPPSPAALGD